MYIIQRKVMTMSFDPVMYDLEQHLTREQNFLSWLESNEDYILECYRESIDELDQVPDDFINSLYEAMEQ